MIAPILEELATELDGKLAIAKVNVDDNGDIAAQYGIRAIPTLLLFKGGQLADQFVGMMDKATLKAKVVGQALGRPSRLLAPSPPSPTGFVFRPASR